MGHNNNLHSESFYHMPFKKKRSILKIFTNAFKFYSRFGFLKGLINKLLQPVFQNTTCFMIKSVLFAIRFAKFSWCLWTLPCIHTMRFISSMIINNRNIDWIFTLRIANIFYIFFLLCLHCTCCQCSNTIQLYNCTIVFHRAIYLLVRFCSRFVTLAEYSTVWFLSGFFESYPVGHCANPDQNLH